MGEVSADAALLALLYAGVALLERDPALAARMRRAMGVELVADATVPIEAAAAEIDVRVRTLRDAARRGKLRLEGPRNARVIRTEEWRRYLRDEGVARSKETDSQTVSGTVSTTATRDADDAAYQRAVARAGRGR